MSKRKTEQALCDVLNKLFPKLPKVVEGGDAVENARWWLAEIADMPGSSYRLRFNVEDSLFEPGYAK